MVVDHDNNALLVFLIQFLLLAMIELVQELHNLNVAVQ